MLTCAAPRTLTPRTARRPLPTRWGTTSAWVTTVAETVALRVDSSWRPLVATTPHRNSHPAARITSRPSSTAPMRGMGNAWRTCRRRLSGIRSAPTASWKRARIVIAEAPIARARTLAATVPPASSRTLPTSAARQPVRVANRAGSWPQARARSAGRRRILVTCRRCAPGAPRSVGRTPSLTRASSARRRTFKASAPAASVRASMSRAPSI
mmetsp:Transcript_17722/g.51021  ORF Transcript_17722/g.51021 Transcript_17722/m.51021 type:complete len:211 (-) Transcript_17722:1858-2490(-)